MNIQNVSIKTCFPATENGSTDGVTGKIRHKIYQYWQRHERRCEVRCVRTILSLPALGFISQLRVYCTQNIHKDGSLNIESVYNVLTESCEEMGRKHKKGECKKIYLTPNSTWGSSGQHKIYKDKEKIRQSKLRVLIINIWGIFETCLVQKDRIQIIHTSKITRKIYWLMGGLYKKYLICTINGFILKGNWGEY